MKNIYSSAAKNLRTLLAAAMIIAMAGITNAQSVGINSDGSVPDKSAILDVQSTVKGFLAPRMTAEQKTAITSPATGLLIYQTDGTAGYYFFNGSEWLQFSGITGPAGPAGEKGDKGIMGIMGLIGLPGIQGIPGLPGLGVAGDRGADGTDGEDGAAGAAGTNGTNGAAGATGEDGPAGAAGTNGTNGAAGATGETGPAGAAGTNGTNGAAGATGETGPQGIQGITGNPGVAFDDSQALLTKTWTSSKISSELASKANSSSLATVATSGIYNDLGGKLSAGDGINIDGANKISLTIPNQVKGDMMYYSGTNWLRINTGTTGKMLTINASGLPEWQTASGSGWSLTGNAGTTPGTNFIGTTDSKDLVFKVYGTQSGLLDPHIGNTSWGYGALNPATTGTDNIAIGQAALSYNTSGAGNTAIGSNTLMGNTSANLNTAIGYWSLKSTTTGRHNTANGAYSLNQNTSGQYNTAVGYNALYANTTGSSNTALGYNAFASGAAFTNSTAIGNGADVTASNQVVLGNTSVTTTLLNGNVGVGTTAPTYHLQVEGTSNNQFQVTGQNAGYGGSTLAKIYSERTTAGTNALLSVGSAFAPNTLYVQDNGNVGIGTTTPDAPLTVKGSSATAIFRLFSAEGGGSQYIDFGQAGASFTMNSANLQNATPGSFTFNSTNNSTTFTRMIIDNIGNVGIGTATPSAKLDVQGASGTTLKIVDGNQAAGKVLTSDASGNASWKTAGSAHYVGELYQGGIVVAVWKEGELETGLIASLTDLGITVGWSNVTSGTAISATSYGIAYDGKSNTASIVAQAGYLSGASSAVQMCDNYTSGAYSDWYLPAAWEMARCYENINYVNPVLGSTNQFSPYNYWTSTESTFNSAAQFSFATSIVSVTAKSTANASLKVRAFRKIN